MKPTRIAVALLFATACASTSEPDLPPSVMQNAATDPRVSEMQTQLTELLERIDVLNHRIAQLEESEAAAEAPAVAAAQPAQSPSPRLAPSAPAVAAVPAPQGRQAPQRAVVGAQLADEYRQAVSLFGRGRYADARRGFESVFEADPSGDLADNALFWIGETYFAVKDYTNAIRNYMRVVNDYSTQNKAPDALFKTAMVQVRTGDLALAQRTFQQVIDRYPYSSTASSAKAELERIRF